MFATIDFTLFGLSISINSLSECAPSLLIPDPIVKASIPMLIGILESVELALVSNERPFAL